MPDSLTIRESTLSYRTNTDGLRLIAVITAVIPHAFGSFRLAAFTPPSRNGMKRSHQESSEFLVVKFRKIVPIQANN